MSDFELEREARIRAHKGSKLEIVSQDFLRESVPAKYSYNFSWLGRPIIQYPQDIVAVQELIWLTRPTLIIETGIAHGGSLALSASMLALLDLCESPQSLRGVKRKVIGIDIDIRSENLRALTEHPLNHYMSLIQGSSLDPQIQSQVTSEALQHKSVMVLLDSNHTHEHVLSELKFYGPLVTKDNYLIVFDTFVEHMPADAYPDRPWGPGDNPHSAVKVYLGELERSNIMDLNGEKVSFKIDHTMDQKLLISVSPEGYLRRG
jgi:cephalosporin hydroxylase